MLIYIIHAIAYQLFFLIVYDVLLKKETFFNWNRAYLLLTAIMSLIIPFIKIERFKDIISQEFIINLPAVIIGSPQNSEIQVVELSPVVLVSESIFWSWNFFFYLGVCVATLIFVFKISKLLWLIKKSNKTKVDGLFIINQPNSAHAFSFLNFIFLGEHIKEIDKTAILKHEKIHVEQGHTLDLLFFELLRIVFWFNPLVYMYQKKMITLHEFIADAEAVKLESKSSYYQNLLSQVFETQNMSFINPFYKQSLIKKRIIMLSKSKSKQIKLFKYALIIPMVLGMLVYTSCVEDTNTKDTSYNIEKETEKETPLIEKVKSVKNQIQVQGNVNDIEEKGLKLLLEITKSEAFSQNLVNEVQSYISQNSKSELTKKISDVFEQIQIQGNISDEENKELKGLLILTSDDGFNDPFFADIIKYVDIPFAIIEHPPVYPGCENLSADEQKKCMSMNISNHVNTNFNTKLADSLNLNGRQRINVLFKINNEGDVVDVRSRAPHPELEAEAIRIINTLPKFTPGEHQGKKVNVPYSLPIIFEVAEKKGNK